MVDKDEFQKPYISYTNRYVQVKKEFEWKIINLREFLHFVLRIYEKAIEFYIDLLGFSIDWEHRFGDAEPIYMQISKNGLTLHLSENERFQTGVIIFIETTGIENFRKSLLDIAKGKLIPDISITDWNTKQLEIEDPFGNLLRFNENCG